MYYMYYKDRSIRILKKRRRVTYGSLQKIAYELGKKGVPVGFRRESRGVTLYMVSDNERTVHYYRNFYDVYDLLLTCLQGLEKEAQEE